MIKQSIDDPNICNLIGQEGYNIDPALEIIGGKRQLLPKLLSK